MRLSPEVNLPADASDLARVLATILRPVIQKLNAICDGQISAVDNASTAAPTTGTWKQGDFVRNSAPAENGSGGSKYVITGWICSVSGTPGTWLQCRSLTGN